MLSQFNTYRLDKYLLIPLGSLSDNVVSDSSVKLTKHLAVIVFVCIVQVQAARRMLHRADAVPDPASQEPRAPAAVEGSLVRHRKQGTLLLPTQPTKVHRYSTTTKLNHGHGRSTN